MDIKKFPANLTTTKSEFSYSRNPWCIYPLFQTRLDFTGLKKNHLLLFLPVSPPSSLSLSLSSSHFHHWLSVPQFNCNILNFPEPVSVGHYDQLKDDIGPLQFSHKLFFFSAPMESWFYHSVLLNIPLCFILSHLNLGSVTLYSGTCTLFLNLHVCLL